MNTKEQIAANIKEIESKLAGRATLLAATKTVPPELINFAADCGITVIGENRVNELLEKYDRIDRSRLHLHFIGALQTNKVKYIIDKVELIHSVDRLSLAAEIDRRAAQHGIVMDILVEVNVAGEKSKSGVSLDECEGFCDKLGEFGHIRLRGLMCIPPKSDEPGQNSKYFSQMYKKFIDIAQKKSDNRSVDILSLGMSGDYPEAVECGSTLVRVGSAIFGRRDHALNK